MDLRVRAALAAPVVLLVLIRAFAPSFLGTPLVPDVALLGWLTWFGVLLSASLWLAAWALTPAILHGAKLLAKRWVLPPIFFIVLAIGLVGALDWVYNDLAAVPHWCSRCPESHLLSGLTNALTPGANQP